MKIKKFGFIIVILALTAILFTACDNTSIPAIQTTPTPSIIEILPVDVIDNVEPHNFILANASPEDTVTGLFSNKFARLIYEISGGAMVVDVFHNSQLGGDAEIFTNVGVGQIDFIIGTTAPQVPTISTLAIFDLPNVFPTAQIARQIFEDPAFMDLIRAEYQAAGYKLLGFADQYYRVMSSNVRIETISDFNGVRIRTMENPFHLAYWSALGASPAPMAFAEVFIALQQGTIDAQENPHEVIVANSFYSVQNYIIHTNHLFHVIGLITNNANFNNLSPAQQSVIIEASNIAIPWARAQADTRVQQRIEIIKASGSTVLELSPELKAQMMESIAGVYDMIRESVGDTLYNALIDAIERHS
ncbi:MAG: TRAP transporter substrate-binding protein [Defluviitaleaceae bacterium]|nr:TRAP transporter substrate-binding protein [Defluviitaleaceae bacterium]